MTKHKLVQLGYEYLNSNNGFVHFVKDEEGNKFLNDLENYPHAYVLACLMDRQINAEKAWMIPVKIKEILGDFSIKKLTSISLDEYKKIFNKEDKLHRFKSTMAEVFYKAIWLIKTKYNGDASNIWKGCPSSATVVLRFLEFDGCGIRIATMAANILARQFKIKFADNNSIEVSPDTHIQRVMYRMGLISNPKDRDEIIYKARELNPEFPGIIDSPLWNVGRTYCTAKKVYCKDCPLKLCCKKILK